MTKGNKKAFSIAAVLLICLSLFCSFLFIAEFSEHDCTHDESCAVCRMIDMNISTINGFIAVAVAIFLLAFFLIRTVRAGGCFRYSHRAPTLITLRTELRN